MDSFVIYFDEITDLSDISYFISSSEIIHNNYNQIISYVNYSYLTVIFLLGLFSSLFTFTFFFNSKNTVPKYIVVQN